MTRAPSPEELALLGLLSLTPRNVRQLYLLAHKRKLPFHSLGSIRRCLSSAQYFGWAERVEPRPISYTLTLLGEDKLDRAAS